MSHIDTLNAYERSAVYQPFADLSQAARALRYKRVEAKAGAELDGMGFAGMRLYPDLYDAASEEYHNARDARTKIIHAYVGDRVLRGMERAA